ncbi:MAG TPA: SpoIIE family protein phosphatase [Candidatus Baltobacteraceae bacterium]|nr:SpoIIE family protein phosphatase [Candidatus Baltobacteraceae bacterium]
MLKGGLRDQAILVGFVPLAFLVLLLGIAFILQQYTEEAAWWTQHSALVLRASDDVQRALNDANDEVVRYTTDRRPIDLVRYRQELPAIGARGEALERLVRDNPEQALRARIYVTYMMRASGLLQRYVGFVQAGKMDAARALDSAPGTRQVAEQMVAAKNAFDTHERDLAVARLGYLRKRVALFGGVVIAVTLLGIIATLLSTGRFGVRLGERLRQLADNARRLGAGEDPPRMSGSDEIADLDRVYQDMARTLRRERRVARTLQRALLPQRMPDIPGVRISSAYSPATGGSDIGGDWYDAFPLTKNLLALSVGDVAGSGLLAATIMGGARQAIRTAARENPDPAHVLRVTNRTLCADGWLASAFYAVLDLRSHTMRFANAGHPPPFVCSAGEPQMLECDGLLLGVDENAAYSVCAAPMPPDGLLVLYTDGLIEGERDVIGGLEKLRAIVCDPGLLEIKSPARAIRARVFERIHARDDAAILTLQYAPSPVSASGTASWSFDARDARDARRVKAEVVRFVTGHAPESDFTTVELIFSELAGNVARHTSGPAQLRLERRDGSLTMEMSDTGDPFLYDRPDYIDPFSESGRGLFLVHALARDVRIERGAGGNTIRVVMSSQQ